ncbi:MAG TPA: DUF2188 domain-containing protein [Rubricoccaceae bacterium]|nr:DUF2188 domain-containing protein [Rubricoccaceae bacterium]
MANTVYHVVPSDGRWAVKREGGHRPSRLADSRDEAFEAAESFARHLAPGRVVLHRADGTIESVHTFDTVPANVATGRDWLRVVLSKPALAAAGVTLLVALGWAMRERG